jgi:ribonucleoside-diphosphate reductase alpha chain
MNEQLQYKWLNNHSRIFLERGYLKQGQTPEQRYREISETAERYLGIAGFADKFEGYLSRGFYSLSTPVITNYGNERGLPVSCFNSHISDTTTNIFEKVGEVGIMSKNGGGTSGYFGDLRSRGSLIKNGEGGVSDGAVRFMELFDKTADVISQGSSRRGSFAAYLPVEHPDIEEFLHIRSEGHVIQNMSIGITITNKWMQEMSDGDKDKRKIWGKIIKKRFETGYPYIFFTDNVNDNAPQVYKDKRLKINASNLCVTGDQRVVSNYGMLTAKELAEIGSNLKLHDNTKMVDAEPMQLIERDADVYRVILENGMEHKITNYHKLVKFTGRVQRKTHQEIFTENTELKNLKIGDSVAIQTQKGIFGDKHMPVEAFLLGMYQADGTQTSEKICIDVWENDFDLIDELQEAHNYVCEKYNTQKVDARNRIYPLAQFKDCSVFQSTVKKKRLTSNALKKSLNFEKGYVPKWIWEANEATMWQYIRGLFYADGTVHVSKSKGQPIQLSLASIDIDFLKEIQLILSNLGMQTSIRVLRKEGETSLPDGKGGHKLYQTKTCWRLIIGNKNDASIFEENTKFLSRKGVNLERRKYRDNTKKFYKIKDIQYIGKEDVFCTKVHSDEHHWICNGFITHNCSEINLLSDDKNSFVCVLSSLNLLHWDEIVETDAIETLVYFLDTVNEEFVRKTEGMRFMETAHHFAKTQRALGAGVLGWHSLLQSKMISFESMEAKLLNTSIWKTIRERADNATIKLAELFGEPELLKGYGRRNVTTLAVAPTTSSSFILGQVSPSIEPQNSNYYVKKLAKGNFTYKNPYLKELLKKYDKNDSTTWDSILIHGGSVQHLDFLTQDEKDVFKTFGELSQKEIVIQAASRQKYIDQAQSLNLMIPPDTKPKDVSELLIEGWRMGIKTFYYQRSANPAQELSRKIMTCTSCES